jgi:hypothetical protein
MEEAAFLLPVQRVVDIALGYEDLGTTTNCVTIRFWRPCRASLLAA